jgi:hypothetical protein
VPDAEALPAARVPAVTAAPMSTPAAARETNSLRDLVIATSSDPRRMLTHMVRHFPVK